ncbi:polyhydroxyalkanoate synthesis repressor PhaR [Croceibacterium sp. LX-88]|jgi:polyhydroxyalkanoate synthesis repressor PhaR|uniref:Polyhydroxyalkanoate synthesis repressor PhaR n=1 Tax=Croceibacterium selenioxidans TaxID=2838833 RepID=A0ABS5W1T5_9SPHN|nr:polyhydroxyalkanoate synthesis repressor PhaR [Croceibacterium selenioxidans]MBT2133728.1 polyhydroxyalkanoate synthesis repressor PhaR [Croceibacterium selenioxidans]
MDEAAAGADPVIIKKYANRRLYNTQSSSYITLEDLSRMTRNGIDFQVLDAKTGADITHAILTQIIMEEEASGEQMLPISFLRQLIAMYGNSMQSLMPHYLEATMENFRNNQRKIQETWTASMGPDALAKLAESNMAMFKAAAGAFIPGNNVGAGAAQPQATPKPAPTSGDELEALKAQMAAMQKKLDELGK